MRRLARTVQASPTILNNILPRKKRNGKILKKAIISKSWTEWTVSHETMTWVNSMILSIFKINLFWRLIYKNRVSVWPNRDKIRSTLTRHCSSLPWANWRRGRCCPKWNNRPCCEGRNRPDRTFRYPNKIHRTLRLNNLSQCPLMKDHRSKLSRQ